MCKKVNRARVSPRYSLVVLLLALPAVAGADQPPAPAAQPVIDRLDSLLAVGDAPQAAAIAVRELRQASVPGPLRWYLAQRACVALQRAGRADEALPYCEQVVMEAADDPESHHALATCLQLLGQDGRAVSEFDEALELAPDRVPWRLQYAAHLQRMGIRREALRQIELAGAACPTCPEVDRALADHALRYGDAAGAVAPLERLGRRDAAPEVRQLLSQAYWDLSRFAALDSLLGGLALADLTGGEVRLLLQADRERGDGSRAVRIVSAEPPLPVELASDPPFWGLVSQLCLAADEAAAALVAIDAAIALEPRSWRWHNNRAAVLVALDRDGDAARALARAQALREQEDR